jgi:hypothetical protein
MEEPGKYWTSDERLKQTKRISDEYADRVRDDNQYLPQREELMEAFDRLRFIGGADKEFLENNRERILNGTDRRPVIPEL